MTYRKRPEYVAAVQWKGNNFFEVCSLTTSSDVPYRISREIGGRLGISVIHGGVLELSLDDWVVREVTGELRVYSPDDFERVHVV
jgi:hypothetical protein